MTDPRSPNNPSAPFNVKAPLQPETFNVLCPICLSVHPVDRVSNLCTVYAADDEDQFILCECGANIEVLPMEILQD